MKKQLATLLAVTALGIGVLSGCGVSAASNSTGSSSDSAGAIEITNVSYDPTRELYAAYNDLFAKHWKEEKGQDVSVVQSHGGSGKQALEVACFSHGRTRRSSHWMSILVSTRSWFLPYLYCANLQSQ